MSSRPFTFDRVVRISIGLAIAVVIFLLVNRLSNVLLPFLLSWLLAYLLQPIVHFFQYTLKFKNRALSVIATLVLFFGVLIGALWIMIPMIIEELTKLSTLTIKYAQQIDTNAIIPVAWQQGINNYLANMNIQKIMHDENIMSAVKNIAPQLWSLLNNSISFVMGLAGIFVMIIYLIFILMDFETISEGWFNMIPPKYRPLIGEIISDLEIGMNRYFRGQALVATIVGTLFIIGFSIIDLPLAIAMGLTIGILDLIPYLKVIGIIPAVTLALLHSSETNQTVSSALIAVLAVFAIVQVIEDMILVPRIMGKVTGMNPAVILLSLSIWGSLMGVSGLIIALPMTTLISSYYKRYVLKEKKTKKGTEESIQSNSESIQ
jgi:predicted PurR-regulated permease PerM